MSTNRIDQVLLARLFPNNLIHVRPVPPETFISSTLLTRCSCTCTIALKSCRFSNCSIACFDVQAAAMFKMRSLSSQSLLVQLYLVNIFAIGRVAAALAFTNSSMLGLTAGEPFTLTWLGASGTTTLTLQNGDPLQTVDTIACKFADGNNTS
jgi:hypothetical protein